METGTDGINLRIMIITKPKLKKFILPIIILVLSIGALFIIPSFFNAKITDDFENSCKPGSVDNNKTWEPAPAAGEEINNAGGKQSCTVCPGGTTKCSDNICRTSCDGKEWRKRRWRGFCLSL